MALEPTLPGTQHRNSKNDWKESKSIKSYQPTRTKLLLGCIANLMLGNALLTWVIRPIWSTVRLSLTIPSIFEKLTLVRQHPIVLKQLGNGLVCDIGSGLGRDLLGVARAYPHLRIELHDRPEVMSLARDVSSTCIPTYPSIKLTVCFCRCGIVKLLDQSLPKLSPSILMICSVQRSIPKLLPISSATICEPILPSQTAGQIAYLPIFAAYIGVMPKCCKFCLKLERQPSRAPACSWKKQRQTMSYRMISASYAQIYVKRSNQL